MNGIRVLSGIVVYLLIGGMMFGLAHNSKSRECGRPMIISADSVEAVATWPAAIGFGLVVGSNTYKAKDWCVEK